MAALMAHDYPGNIRELKNSIEHCFILCKAGVIQRSHLPKKMTERDVKDELIVTVHDKTPSGRRCESSYHSS